MIRITPACPTPSFPPGFGPAPTYIQYSDPRLACPAAYNAALMYPSSTRYIRLVRGRSLRLRGWLVDHPPLAPATRNSRSTGIPLVSSSARQSTTTSTSQVPTTAHCTWPSRALSRFRRHPPAGRREEPGRAPRSSCLRVCASAANSTPA